MATTFSPLEQNILKAKGLSDDNLARMSEVGIVAMSDFATVGDAETFAELIEVPLEVAAKVMTWAAAIKGAVTGPVDITVDSPDAVYCSHCKARQPKDYHAGDLCLSCGKQAEPILACFWCGVSGPGKFCRSCGAEFVATSELDLAVQLRRDGLAKNEIPAKLKIMSPEERDVLWGLVRRAGTR
ncbi:MAG TPA: hypothetical protein VFG83_14450 [Kofleriaceae bacterium]|nr:hypothetical protein [Kofleriaceae bacterium]